LLSPYADVTMNRYYVHDRTLFENGLLSLITAVNISVITYLMPCSSVRFDRQGRCLIVSSHRVAARWMFYI